MKPLLRIFKIIFFIFLSLNMVYGEGGKSEKEEVKSLKLKGKSEELERKEFKVESEKRVEEKIKEERLKIGVRINPGNGEIDFLTTGEIKISFSEPMDKKSVEEAFLLMDKKIAAKVVKGKFIWAGNILIFRPHEPLYGKTRHTILISKSAKSLQGDHLKEYIEISFETAKSNPPVVVDNRIEEVKSLKLKGESKKEKEESEDLRQKLRYSELDPIFWTQF